MKIIWFSTTFVWAQVKQKSSLNLQKQTSFRGQGFPKNFPSQAAFTPRLHRSDQTAQTDIFLGYQNWTIRVTFQPQSMKKG